MKINEVSKLTGLTVRALHHYDSIGLVSPSVDSSGYRNYCSRDLSRLQEVVFFRELDFSLENIREMLGADDRTKLPLLRKGTSSRPPAACRSFKSRPYTKKHPCTR